VAGVDQLILEEDAPQGSIAERMLGADKAICGSQLTIHE
jgi:hypothetical protein